MQSCISDDEADPELNDVQQDIAPPPPAGLSVANLAGGFSPAQQLTWSASPGATSYLVLRGVGGTGSEVAYTTCCTSGVTTFLANHLTAGTNYCWQVKGVNSIGQKSGPSNEVCLATAAAGVISPPATVTATAVSSSRINVAWTAVASATRYIINRSVSGGPFTLLTSVSSPTLAFPNIALTPNTSYCYTLETVTNQGTSLPSPPACDTTFVLGLEGYWKLSEAMGTTANDSSGFGRNATLSGGAAFSTAAPQAPIDPALGNIEPHLDTAAAGVASTAAGISALRLTGDFSIVVWVEQPVAGANLSIMGMRNAGSCGTGSGWELSQSATGLAFIGQTGGAHSFGQSLTVGAWTHLAVTFTANTLLLYVNGVQVATSAYTAVNSLAGALSFGHFGGCASGKVLLDEAQIYSRALTPAEVASFGTLPPAPTALTLTKNLSTSQGLSWTAPGTGADRWIILRAEGAMASGSETHYTHAPNPPVTFNASHLDPSTQYAWEVQTVKGHLISLPSNEILATTPAGPAAPTGVTATPVSKTRIDVAWTAVANATQYFVFESTTGPAGTYTQVGHVNSPTVAFAVTGLTANTAYSFEVQAEDSGLTRSPMSAPATATTLP